MLYNIILFDGAYFLLAVMAGGVSNQPENKVRQ